MNLVVDEAAEVFVKDAKPRRDIGVFTIHFPTSKTIDSLFFRPDPPQGRQHHPHSTNRISSCKTVVLVLARPCFLLCLFSILFSVGQIYEQLNLVTLFGHLAGPLPNTSRVDDDKMKTMRTDRQFNLGDSLFHIEDQS
jgi:hypothetical protein